MVQKPLAGKSALVTGGARRIGRAICLELGRAGASVAVGYRGSAEEAARTVAALEAGGARALAVAMDVEDEASVIAAP